MPPLTPSMQRGIGMLTSREVSLHCENNRLRKGLVIAERELSAMFREGKPSWTCEKAIKEIREALKGGEK